MLGLGALARESIFVAWVVDTYLSVGQECCGLTWNVQARRALALLLVLALTHSVKRYTLLQPLTIVLRLDETWWHSLATLCME